MKLHEVARQKEVIEVDDGEGGTINVLLVSMNSMDIAERNKYYDTAFKESIRHSKELSSALFDQLDELDDDQLRDYVLGIEVSRMVPDIDLIDIENADAMTDEEIKAAREVEFDKIVEDTKVELNNLPMEDVKMRAQIYMVRSAQISKFNELMAGPSLVIVARDPETGEKLLSMDPDAENYVGNLDAELFGELLTKSESFRDQVDVVGLRKLVEDPNFLLWSPPATKKE